MEILIAILVLGAIIFIHELGHFLTAKLFGMPVSEFAIGMGPQVVSYDTNSTTYSLRAIPIGGFVNIEGMEIDSKVEDGFNTKPAYARFIVLIAGVMMNFILAFVILFISIYTNGKYVPSSENVVGHISKEVSASKYIQEKDKILEIDGKKIAVWDDIGKTIQNLEEDKKEVDITLLRGTDTINSRVPLTYDKTNDRYMLGILPNFRREKFTLSEATNITLESGVKMFTETLNSFKMLGSGKVKKEEISGPIGIIKVVGEASRQGADMLIWLTALLSINIGILNLLPLPALDGGRILFVLLEMIGIKVNKKVEERIHMVGMFLLFAFIIFITTNDIFNFMR